jgi:hypothetical protein
MASLTERLLAAREAWVDIPGVTDGRQVRVRRPAEAEMPALLLHGDLRAYLRQVVGWRRWTEAQILGQSGSDADVPFDVELWVEVALDHTDWCAAVAEKIKEMCGEHMKAKVSAAGN